MLFAGRLRESRGRLSRQHFEHEQREQFQQHAQWHRVAAAVSSRGRHRRRAGTPQQVRILYFHFRFRRHVRAALAVFVALSSSSFAAWQWQPKLVSASKITYIVSGGTLNSYSLTHRSWHKRCSNIVSYEFIWIRECVTIISRMLTTTCCLVVGLAWDYS